VNGDELPLQMSGQFGRLDAMDGQPAPKFVAIILALRCGFQVDQARVSGDLDTLVA
jgi:hypothetical protein